MSGRSLMQCVHCRKTYTFTGMEFDVIKVTFHMTKKTLEFAFMYSNSSSTQVLNVGELKKSISFGVR